MGWLDPLARALIILFSDSNPDNEQDDPSAIQEAIVGPAESFAHGLDAGLNDWLGGFIRGLAQDIIDEVREGGQVTPGNVRERLRGAEGASVDTIIGAIAAEIGIEAIGLAQIESHGETLARMIDSLSMDTILGYEVDVWFSEGLRPALVAKVNRETRSKFVSLQDFIEDSLRRKEEDTGWLKDPARYGIRPDQVPLLERVSVNPLEPEELLEEPIQLGIVPSTEAVEQNLDRSGIGESAKQVYRDMLDVAPRSADLWEQRTTTEELVRLLDGRVSKDNMTVEEAVSTLPAEADNASNALRDRWQIIDDLPAGSPTRGQLQSWFGWGLINRRTFVDELESIDVDPNEYPAVVGENILSNLDGDLRTALGMGLIDHNYYSSLARSVGLRQQDMAALLAGASLDEIALRNLRDSSDLGDLSTSSIIDIGQSRQAGLSGQGIGNVADLANASVDAVMQGAALSESAAQTIIDRAQAMVD